MSKLPVLVFIIRSEEDASVLLYDLETTLSERILLRTIATHWTD
ncbi:hypothetical protein HanRHA438_Chr16g0757511 [Helianthus annuus]|nr:hypothetical protein HanRHA438_Chr16g0757511 [Helianthus annuus]